MKIKTSVLEGAALDWAVAKCEGYTELCTENEELGMRHHLVGFGYTPLSKLDYSTNWAIAGPIIERERIGFFPKDGHRGSEFRAFIYTPTQHDLSLEDSFDYERRGPTPLIATMRCYVASKLGNEVDIPKELT